MEWHTWSRAIVELIGSGLMLIMLADVFLTILYARLNTSILSQRVGLLTWGGVRMIGRWFPHRRQKILSFGGPVLLVVLISVWALGLTLGGALIFYPNIGTAIRASGSERTPTDFVAAMFAAAGSMSIVGAGQFGPKTTAFRLLYMANSLVGMCMISLTLTYFMQIYTALQRRNALALQIHIATRETGDAAWLIAARSNKGDLSDLASWLSEAVQSTAQVKESHHFYALLMYFRFDEPLYAVPRLTLVLLDTVSLIRSALDPQQYSELIESASAEELWTAATRLLTGVAWAMPGGETKASANEALREQWRRRYRDALPRLREAGIHVTEDLRAGEERYLALRLQWNHLVAQYFDFMDYEEESSGATRATLGASSGASNGSDVVSGPGAASVR